MTEEESKVLRDILAELREMRAEVRQDREVREALDSLREAGRRRSQEWRKRNVTQRHGAVTVGSLDHVDLSLKKLKQEQDQKQKIPASRHGDVGNVTRPTWEAYSAAYEARHHAKPVRNATVNAQMARFVKRVGAEEAPGIAEFYVGHRSAWYVQHMHPVGLLLQDAEKLRTEWFTGQQTTATEARNGERTQANANVFSKFLKGTGHA